MSIWLDEMWRDHYRNRKAARLADELRPPRNTAKERGTGRLQTRLPGFGGDLIQGIYAVANEFSAPISPHGFGWYLRQLATRRPNQFLRFFQRMVVDECERKNELRKVREAFRLAMEDTSMTGKTD